MRSIFGAAFLVWTACHGGRAPATRTARPESDTTVEGKLTVAGVAPDMAVFVSGSGGRFELVGTMRSELATLDGAVVRATGSAAPARPPLGPATLAVDVRTYEIDSIAGGVPIVGILAVSGSDLTIGDMILSGAPAELRRWAGAKVWIVGVRGTGKTLNVQAFGVLHQAPGHASDHQ